MRRPRRIAKLCIRICLVCNRLVGTQKNSLKIKWIQGLLNHTNALSNDLMLIELNTKLQATPSPI